MADKPKIPRPRKSGQDQGGSAFNKVNRATHAQARVTQKAGKAPKKSSGGGGKKGGGCLILIPVGIYGAAATAAGLWELLA